MSSSNFDSNKNNNNNNNNETQPLQATEPLAGLEQENPTSPPPPPPSTKSNSSVPMVGGSPLADPDDNDNAVLQAESSTGSSPRKTSRRGPNVSGTGPNLSRSNPNSPIGNTTRRRSSLNTFATQSAHHYHHQHRRSSENSPSMVASGAGIIPGFALSDDNMADEEKERLLGMAHFHNDMEMLPMRKCRDPPPAGTVYDTQRDLVCPTVHSGLNFDMVVGTYYSRLLDVEVEAVPCDVRLSQHPDGVLRRCGVIGQIGSYRSGAPVYYNARRQQWMRRKDNELLPALQLSALRELEDVIPGGIINVIGEVDLRLLGNMDSREGEKEDVDILADQIDSLQHILGTRRVEQQERAKRKALQQGRVPDRVHRKAYGSSDAAKRLKAHSDRIGRHRSTAYDDGYTSLFGSEVPQDEVAIENDLDGIVDMADVDSNFLKPSEIVKFLRQYLTRAIPNAARSSSALVVFQGRGDTSELLAKGMDIVLDRSLPERREGRAKIFGHPLFLGINAKRFDSEMMRRGYTHHIFLEMGGHDGVVGSKCSRCDVDITAANKAIVCPGTEEFKTLRKRVAEGSGPDVAKKLDTLPANSPLYDDVSRYKQMLVETLAGGYQRTHRSSEEPPNRRTIPVVTILIGGDIRVRQELLQSVNRGWPILILEGSGGYADVLSSAINKVNEILPDAGIDEFRTFLSGVDPVTAEIINRSNYTIVRRGTRNEQLVRYIGNAMKGDEILLKAWRRYAVWDYNSRIWQFNNEFYQIAVLMVSISATTVAVIQTFVQLLWKLDGLPYPDEWAPPAIIRSETRYKYLFYTMMQWSVIALPIGLTLLHALINRANAWVKWTALRVAAEGTLREIYMYRTRTLGYSYEEVKRKKQLKEEREAAGENFLGKPLKHGAEVYSTREDLLGMRLISIQDELAASEVSNETLQEYDGAIPPTKILHHGDSGFSDLSPDEYVKYRAIPARLGYARYASESARMMSLLTYQIYFVGAAGTTLAALSAYGLDYLQAWVALTTALVNSYQQFMDYSRVTSLTELYNMTVSRLADIEGWWAALGPRADDMVNRNKLVDDVEKCISDEMEGWAKQLQKGAEALKKLQEEENKLQEDLKAVKEGRELAEVREMRELGLDAFSSNNIKAAMLDPKGPMASKLKKQLVRINDKLDDQLHANANTMMSTETGRKVTEMITTAVASAVPVVEDVADFVEGVVEKKDDIEALVHNIENLDFEKAAQVVADILPTDVAKIVHDNYIREKFMIYVRQEKINVKQMSIHFIIEVLCRIIPVLTPVIEALGPREVMELVKRLCMMDLAVHLLEVLDAEEDRKVIEGFLKNAESFIAEMRKIVLRADAEFLDHSSLIQLIKHAETKQLIMRITPRRVTKLVKTARDLLNPQLNPVAAFSETAMTLIADNDCDALMSDTLSRVSFWSKVPELRELPVNLESMTKEELLKFFPERFQYAFKNRTQLQLSQYLQRLSAGTPASRVFERLCFVLPDLMSMLVETLRVLSNPEWRERFIVAAESLNQIDINRWSKGEMVKAMLVNNTFSAEIGDYVLENVDEFDLFVVTSGIQALFSNSYSGRYIDRLADELSTFDLRGVLSVEDRDKLCAKITDLREFDIYTMTKPQILKVLHSESLVRNISPFSVGQIREMLSTLMWIMYDPFTVRVARTARDALALRLDTGVGQEVLRACNIEVMDRLLHIVAHLTHREIVRLRTCTKFTDVINALCDPIVSRSFVNTVRDSTKQHLYSNALIAVVEFLYGIVGDPVLEVIIRRHALCIRDRTVVAKVGLALYGADYQSELRRRLVVIGDRLAQESIHNQMQMDLTAIAGIVQDHTVLTELTRVGLSETEIRDYLIGFGSNFVIGLPYAFFLRLADAIYSFDVRDIFAEVSGRYRLALMMVLVFPKIKVMPEAHDLDADDVRRIKCTKGDLLKIMDTLPAYFETTRSQVRLCKEYQMRTLFLAGVNLLSSTDLGRAFRGRVQRLAESTSVPGAVVQFEAWEATHLLRSHYEIYGAPFREVLCDFNARKFAEIIPDERMALLSKFIEDDDLLTFLCQLNAASLETVFVHMKCPGSIGLKENVARRFREDVVVKEGDAALGPEVALGEGEPEYDDDI